MKRFIEENPNKNYDIIIIGGGITGAAVAYEAASRGFSVALVEKSDFGGATSAATSKMIHGGLRYLANYEFSLVRESLRERKVLENIAPNLVYPYSFLIPLYHTRLRSKWIIEPGMIIYDLLSFDKMFTWDKSKRIPLHRYLTREKVLQLESVVNPEGLTGAILYQDCISLAPERVTLAFIKSAINHGAQVSNYAKVEDFMRVADRVVGVVVRDLLSEKFIEIRGKITINCGGPWADLILAVAGGKQVSQQIRRSEGIHIVTKNLTSQFCVGGVTPGGRSCTIRPWRGYSLIGTTDREYIGDPESYEVTKEKIEEFIQDVNAAFGKPDLIAYSDILYAYGGLRPLIDDQTEDVYKTSRKYEIYDNDKDGLNGLITVEGGKYTTSRNLAENVMRVVTRKLGVRYKKSITADKHLSGCEIPDINAFISLAKSSNTDFDEITVDYLARLYGTDYEKVLDIARSNPIYAQQLNADGELPAQVLYAIREEMALTLADILLRRTSLGTLGNPGEKILAIIAEIAAEELKWSKSKTEHELRTARKLITLPA